MVYRNCIFNENSWTLFFLQRMSPYRPASNQDFFHQNAISENMNKVVALTYFFRGKKSYEGCVHIIHVHLICKRKLNVFSPKRVFIFKWKLANAELRIFFVNFLVWGIKERHVFISSLIWQLETKHIVIFFPWLYTTTRGAHF